MTKCNPVPACEQALLFKREKRAARERASQQQSRFRVSSCVSLARLLFTISTKWRVYSHGNPALNLQTRFLYTFSRFSICCSVKSSDEEDLWSNCNSKGRAPSSRICVPINILHLLTLCFLLTILSFYSSSNWRTPDLYTSRPHVVRRSWFHKCVTIPLIYWCSSSTI